MLVGIFNFYSNFKRHLCTCLANSGEPVQTPHFVASDLVLHCLPMSHKKDARLIRVKVKQPSSLCLSEMIAKLEITLSVAY